MGRLVQAGNLVFAQVDIRTAPSAARTRGVVAGNLISTVFSNNGPLSWPIQDGLSVQDSQINSGSIYFNEIVGCPGFYSVRFFPDRTGFWRVVLTMGSSEFVLDFDVRSFQAPDELSASFV